MYIYYSAFKRLIRFLHIKRKKKHSKAIKKVDKIKLSRGEITSLLSIFNRINIFNIENENAIWSEMLTVVDNKQSEKIMNAKQRFINFSWKMEKKLRKISRMRNNESSYYMKEKLLINGLVYLELLKYDETNDFNWENLNFNKTTLQEYWEAKKYIKLSFENIKENIEGELMKMFKKIAIYKRNLAKNDENHVSPKKSHESLSSTGYFKPSSPSMIKTIDMNNRLYFFDSDETMKANFTEYLKWKKYEVIDELMIFKDIDNIDGIENKQVAVEEFLEDGDFKEFIEDLKQKKLKYIEKSRQEEEEEVKDEENSDKNEIVSKINKMHEFSENQKKYFKEETRKFGYLCDISLNEEENMEILKEKERNFHDRMEVINSKIDTHLYKISQDKVKFKQNLFIEENNMQNKQNLEKLMKEPLEIDNFKTPKKVIKEDSSDDDDDRDEHDDREPKEEEMNDNFLYNLDDRRGSEEPSSDEDL